MTSKFYALNSGYQLPMTGGSWENKALNTLLAAAGLNYTSVPSDTTFYAIEYESTSVGAIYGCENSDDTEDWLSSSGLPASNIGRAALTKFIPANAAHTLRLYLSSNASGKWWLRGMGNSATWITPVDKSAGVTGTGTYIIDCSADLPSGAANGTALCEISSLMKIGAVGLTAGQYKVGSNIYSRVHILVPLDSLRRFEVSGSTNLGAGSNKLRVLAWFPPEAIVHNTSGSTFRYTPTSLTTQEQLPYSSNTVFDFWQISNAATTSASSTAGIAELRAHNDTTYNSNLTDGNSDIGYRYVRPDANGLVDVYMTTAGHYATWRAGFVADSSAAEIVGISTFVAGATATVTFNKSVSSVTRLRVTSAVGLDTHYIDITAFTGSTGTTRTFTVPDLGNNIDGVRLGAVTVTPTTNTGTGADFTGLVYTKTGYTPINIEDPVTANVCAGDTPGLATKEQLVYDSSTGAFIDKQGAYQDPAPVYVGVQTIYRYCLTDFKWYSFTWTVASAVTNAAPVVTPLSLDTDKNVTVGGQLVATDTDLDTLTYSVTTAASHGTGSVNSSTGVVSYVPTTNYIGADSFVVSVNDGQGHIVTGTVSITIHGDGIPDPLIYSSQTNADPSTEYTSALGTVTGMDTGESTAFTITNGTYSKNGGSYVSTPGTFTQDDTIRLRGTSDQYYGRTKTITLTATNGNVVSTYKIVNKNDPLVSGGGNSTALAKKLNARKF